MHAKSKKTRWPDSVILWRKRFYWRPETRSLKRQRVYQAGNMNLCTDMALVDSARKYATEGASMFDTATIRALALVAAMFVAFCGAVELLQRATYHEVLQN